MRLLSFVLILLIGVLGFPGGEYADMEIAQDFSPRYYLGDPRQALAKRDNCDADHHSCRDIGFPDFCCENSRYCIVLRNGSASCCPVERECTEDQPCSSMSYFCHTSTVTVVDASTSTVTLDACCPRACTSVSAFRCADEFGGGCCAYGEFCGTSSKCLNEQTKEPTAVEPLDPGCTTSQHRCEDGDGCCDDWKHCATSGTVRGCAMGNPSNTNLSVETKDPGLSDAEKAGIAVGVVIGAAGIAAALTWVCIAKRRGRTLSYRNGATGDNATEVTSDSRPQPGRLMGVPQDDLPSPVAGPYTHVQGHLGPAQLQQERGAVPHQPHHPDDIAVPVEMEADTSDVGLGLRSSSAGAVAMTETPSINSGGREWLTPGESPGQVYELYGSTTPSPYADGPSPLGHDNSSPLVPSPSEHPGGNRSPPP